MKESYYDLAFYSHRWIQVFLFSVFLLSGQTYHLYVMACCHIFGTLVNNTMKEIARKHLPESVTRRPEDFEKTCIRPGQSLSSKDKYMGFPSGHSQNAAIFAVMTIYWIMVMSKIENKILASMLLILFLIYVGWSRIKFHCHTEEQVVSGGAIGILLGFLCIYLWQKISKSN